MRELNNEVEETEVSTFDFYSESIAIFKEIAESLKSLVVVD